MAVIPVVKMSIYPGQGILSNHEIDRILKPIPFFRGTFSADTIPAISSSCNCIHAFIVNTASQNKTGEHWVGLVINEQKDCYYFDSFGNQILNISILHSLRKMGIVTYKYNTKEIQSISSSSCGYFCLALILAWRLKIPYDAFIALFSEEKQENNEAVCYKFIKQTINS